jgi:hypothetical protein
VKKTFLTWIIVFLSTNSLDAKSANPRSHDSRKDIYLLASFCGYVIDKKHFSAQVVKSSSKVRDNVILLYFHITIKPERKNIYGRLFFSCFTSGSTASKQDYAQKTTAADEIALEDSGGRYARHILWQQKYRGRGWNGTVAYTNSVYGDGRRSSISDYFMICPDKDGLTCFSFEVTKEKLNTKESNSVPQLLKGIGVSDRFSR